MIRDYVRKYYLDQDNNCAEALLHAADEALSLHLSPEAYRLVAGYGGGLGCGDTCGAICGAVAVVSYLLVGESAHSTPGFRTACADCTHAMREAFGATSCVSIAPRFKSKETRCLPTVERAADVLEDVLKRHGVDQ